MSNKAYLYSSSAPLIYPYWHAAARGGGTNHCIGFVDGCIPLLWLLLFAPEDMRTETLTDDNGRSWTLPRPASRAPMPGRVCRHGGRLPTACLPITAAWTGTWMLSPPT